MTTIAKYVLAFLVATAFAPFSAAQSTPPLLTQAQLIAAVGIEALATAR